MPACRANQLSAGDSKPQALWEASFLREQAEKASVSPHQGHNDKTFVVLNLLLLFLRVRYDADDPGFEASGKMLCHQTDCQVRVLRLERPLSAGPLFLSPFSRPSKEKPLLEGKHRFACKKVVISL